MSNSISGQAAAGALITLSGTASATTFAGPTGLYSFTGLAAGPYTITPSKTGLAFSPASKNVTIVATDITGVNFLATSANVAGSVNTLRKVIDRIVFRPELVGIFDIGGYTTEPACTAGTDVFTAICGVNFPHKWNRVNAPQFYTNSWQQDYALINPDNTSVYNIEWFEQGVAFDINNTSIPKPWVRVECGRSLPQRTGTYTNDATQIGDPGFIIASLPNQELYYGTWGQADVGNSTLGNNPQPGSVYINPVASFITAASWSATAGGQAVFTVNSLPATAIPGNLLNVAGVTPTGYNGNWVIVSVNDTAPTAPTITVTMTVNPGTYQAGGIIDNSGVGSQPANPITQIQDANGNFLVLTTYGTEGTTAPLASSGALPGTQVSGTGATTVWTVVDPIGLGVRILQVPSQTGVVWQFNLVGQMPPVKFESLNQSIAPLPDKYEPYFRAGVVAKLFENSPLEDVRAKASEAWAKWLKSLSELREVQDRELEEYSFRPERTIFGSGRNRNNFQGAAWPYNYPRP